jgi:signal transduction histidine kinase
MWGAKTVVPLTVSLVICWLFWGLTLSRDSWEPLDLALQDRILARKPVKPDTNVAVVAYGDNTMTVNKASGIAQFVALIDYIARQQPKVVALDFASLDPSLFLGDTLDVFSSLFKIHDNIVFGLSPIVLRRGTRPLPLPPEVASRPAWATADSSALRGKHLKVDFILRPFIPSYASASGLGHLLLDSEPDGVFRRVPAWVEWDGRILPALGVESAIRFLLGNNVPVGISAGVIHAGRHEKQLGIPLDDQARLYFRGESDPAKGLRTYRMEDVLAEIRSVARPQGEGPFHGKIVFIGNVSMRTGRYVPVQGNGYYPSLLIHADVARSILQGDFVRPMARTWTWILLLIPVMGMSTAAMIRNGWQATGLGVGFWLALMAGGAGAVYAGMAFPMAAWSSFATLALAATGAWKAMEARMRLVAQRERMKVMLEEQKKGTLAAMVNHEVKNIMGALRDPIDELKRIDDGKPEAALQFEKMEELLRRLQDFAKVMLGSVFGDPKEKKSIDLHLALFRIFDFFGKKIRNAGIQAVNELPEETCVMGFEGQIFFVFYNLVLNAIEASSPGGEIRVSLLKSGSGKMRIRVEDKGKGIPRHDLGKVFDPEYTMGKPEGTGKGLALVQFIMENQHEGGIMADSELGKWTRFDLEFPREKA